MSQHDFNIANQTAPNFRSDLNLALTALASLSSGATAPSTTYANMLWYDTANNILKMRNEANSGWIDVGYLDQGVGAFRILDDTQVTNSSGTQTGLLGDQSTATWEAGTGTTESLVSPAKVKAAVDSFVTSSKVLSLTAGATAGGIGTYALLGSPAPIGIFAGSTYAGSGLVFAGTRSTSTFTDNTAADIASGATPAGTWQAMGTGSAGAGRITMTLFLRIS